MQPVCIAQRAGGGRHKSWPQLSPAAGPVAVPVGHVAASPSRPAPCRRPVAAALAAVSVSSSTNGWSCCRRLLAAGQLRRGGFGAALPNQQQQHLQQHRQQHQQQPAALRPLAVPPCASGKAKGQPAGAAGKGQGAAKGKQQQQQQREASEEAEEEEEYELSEGEGEEEEDLLDDEEGGEQDLGEDGFLDEDDEGEGDDFASSFLEPDDADRAISTGGTSWGDVVLEAVTEVLAQPNMQGLELYLFRAIVSSKKVDIRLDKLDDLYGSPSIDDIERFSRALYAVLDRKLGVEAAGDISFEVSSPGAERLVAVPAELSRFAGLPLKVEYRTDAGADASSVVILDALDEAAGVSTWRLANVRANATTKGRAISKKQLAQRLQIPLAAISRVRIHVDF